ncbi:MAG: hypothetical protein N2483_03940 [Burkholderiaceae bacterium]|nr:hypothetical protein [Burkholderiaceae bacterium]
MPEKINAEPPIALAIAWITEAGALQIEYFGAPRIVQMLGEAIAEETSGD